MKYILTDIEGTTTDIDFVHQVLFPYAYEKLPAYVRLHEREPEVAEIISEVKQTMLTEKEQIAHVEAAIQQLLNWIQEDRKHPALKQLQGMIWQEGYETGGFRGHVYPDVVPQIEAWRAQGIGIGIYSSGSVAAQKLLFGYSTEGDLNHLFDHNFDTGVGHKKEANSYRNIAKEIGLSPEEILFLSDVEAELDAAKAAGLQTTQLVRPGIEPTKKHPTAKDFTEIDIKI